MLKNKVTAENVEAGLRDMAECSKLVDLASKQAILDNKSSIRETPAYLEAKELVHKTCETLGIPIPAFFRDETRRIFH